ncbi:MAG: molecular chaperone DnaJ [Oscillospiraceae bacterium]|nr:molecular chaperone DnaJ [Oscillospiraceae bacterium]
MAEKRDYYEVIGVDRNATDDQIKAEYRKKAKKYHPDLNPDDKDAEVKFKELGEAYEILSDKEKKARYDQFGHAGVDPSYGAGRSAYGGGFSMDLGDLFGSIFGAGFGGSTQSSRRYNPSAPRKGNDIHVSIPLSFMEAVKGTKKTVNISPYEECDVCKGSGAAPGTSPVLCPDCRGTGYVTVQRPMPFGTVQSTNPCGRCSGKGKIIEKVCPKCSGQGRTKQNRRIEITIPAGIDDDQNLSVNGRGDAGLNGGPPGNVIAIITVRPDSLFLRNRYDVTVNTPITFAQATLGAKVIIPSIDGKTEFNIPAGTQSGDTFRLKGKGIPFVNGRGRGDQYVKVEIEVPKKLSREQRQALEQLDSTLVIDKNYEKRKSFEDRLKREFR